MSKNPYSVPKFKGFARFYDQFMLRLVNYPAWVDYIEKIFKEYNCSVKSILDLACGTGIPSLLFAKKGYQITGVDSSQPMLDVFWEKTAKTNYSIRLINADIRSFSISEPVDPAPILKCSAEKPQSEISLHNLKNSYGVDAAVSLYDSINYLLTETDLLACFKCVAESIKPSGLFVFDMNTIYCLEHFWDNRETPRRVGDIYSVWKNSYNPDTKISTLKLTVYTDDGEVFEETHQERGYTLEEIKNNLLKAGFSDSHIYAHLTLLPPNDSTLRIMVVARR